jgi:hypothetical protein
MRCNARDAPKAVCVTTPVRPNPTLLERYRPVKTAPVRTFALDFCTH